MLALKMLIYALVNSAFSGFASLKLHLFIPSLRGLAKLLFSQPLYCYPCWPLNDYSPIRSIISLSAERFYMGCNNSFVTDVILAQELI